MSKKNFTTMEEVVDFLSSKKKQKEQKLQRRNARKAIERLEQQGFTMNAGFKTLLKGGR